jgi:hypothetical protein
VCITESYHTFHTKRSKSNDWRSQWFIYVRPVLSYKLAFTQQKKRMQPTKTHNPKNRATRNPQPKNLQSQNSKKNPDVNSQSSKVANPQPYKKKLNHSNHQFTP